MGGYRGNIRVEVEEGAGGNVTVSATKGFSEKRGIGRMLYGIQQCECGVWCLKGCC